MRFSLLALVPAFLLAACAPSATGSSTAQTAAPTGLIRQGDTLTIGGRDQFNEPMNGTIVLKSAPVYNRVSDSWKFDTDTYYVYVSSPAGTGTSQFWDNSDPKREKACIVFGGVAKDGPGGGRVLKTPITGVGISGSEAELNAVFAKLDGTGVKLTGGTCTVTVK
ncbi:hypothetical protein E7T09_11165 [Deinococcus sp. KSM4-11]|uniref:hypothetical protein n=1 Tax=Deinococcus sp. KSM4-11 TaxID=2568654 RepID=UPI0010A4ACFD|nr:hypothetical protein [Deinococcus sp. KSM4-11]THF86646.1 hypothetical protein E7T09_11165 [Deinococcus sp. KSM4-11]